VTTVFTNLCLLVSFHPDRGISALDSTHRHDAMGCQDVATVFMNDF